MSTSTDIKIPSLLALIEVIVEKCVKAYAAEHNPTRNPNLCLSRDEIAEFTRARTKGRQLQFLIRNGIRHYVDGDGWPVVTLAAVEGDVNLAPQVPTWQSNKAGTARPAGRFR